MLWKYELKDLGREGVVYAVDAKDAEHAVRKAYEEYLMGIVDIGIIAVFQDNIANNVCETYSE